jgi:chromosome partitioning protein
MIISVLGVSGGVGKSTVSTNLSVGLAKLGHSVCLLDIDDDGTSTSWFARREDEALPLDCVSITDQRVLKKSAVGLAERYDVVVIDGTPRLDACSLPVALADLVLLPICPSPKDLFKVKGLVELVDELKSQAEIFRDDSIEVRFIQNLLEHDSYSKELRSVLEAYPFEVMRAKLSKRVDFRKALLAGKSVVEMACVARQDVRSLASEVNELLKTKSQSIGVAS